MFRLSPKRVLGENGLSISRSIVSLACALALSAGSVGVPAAMAANGPDASIPVVALHSYQVGLFAKGTGSNTKPDAIEVDGQHIYIDYQDNTSKDGSNTNPSTIVEYSPEGKELRTFSVAGHADGMRIDPSTHLLWVSVNEDANSALYTIDPNTGDTKTFQFSGAPHGGGYDDIQFANGQAYIVASNPTLNSNGVNTFPALDRVTLQGNTAVLTPVLMGNASATDTTTNMPVTLNVVDPDSLTVDPLGNVVLIDQAGSEIISLQNACSAKQTLTRIPVGTQLDDTVWTNSTQGTLYVVDTKQNAVYTLTTDFKNGTIYTEMPSDSGVGGAVGIVDPATGFITPVAIGFGSPTGMIFVPSKQSETPASAANGTCASSGSVTFELASTQTGTLSGSAAGSFATYHISNPTGSATTLTLSYGPFNQSAAHKVGVNVYQNGSKIASVTGQAKGSGDTMDNASPSVTFTPSASGGAVLIQVFNYGDQSINYTLSKS